MHEFLSTDELVDFLNHQTHPNHSPSIDSKYHKKRFRTRTIIFFILLSFAILHLFYVSIPLISSNRGVNAFGSATIVAVTMDQPLGNTVNAHVVIMGKLNPEEIKTGDHVITYGLYGTDIYWVAEVVSVNSENQTCEVTFDGVIANVIHFQDIEGTYIRRANLLNTISYISSSLVGYIFLLGIDVIGFSSVYYFYIRKKKEKPIT